MSGENISVVYVSDETDLRMKNCGLTLIDQLLASIHSLRRNWSDTVEVFLYHSKNLSDITRDRLRALNVQVDHLENMIEPEFPLSNKILIGDAYKGKNDILFLDCDTIIHQPIRLGSESDMIVAFDCMKNIEKNTYIEISNLLKIDLGEIEIYGSPAFEYYYNDKIEQFPVFNSGVYFLRKELQRDFYFEYENIFSILYAEFKKEKWRFYIEQIAFCMAIIKLKITYSIFPKGYNFICTPRAPYLKNWDKKKIIIEHYAGDNGEPLKF